MRRMHDALARAWIRVGPTVLPFADAASDELPLGRLLRLSLFQVSVGMALVLLNGTLNRVMIVELAVPAWLVSLMVSLPLLFAPFRALLGFRSDTHRSSIGWRRVPYIWVGTLLQWGGLAIMPFALIVLSGDTHGPAAYGYLSAALAFLLVGAGLHTTQTAGLALATDLAPADARPRVVALLFVMLLAGMVASSVVIGALLEDFSQVRLIQVVQGAAVATFLVNLVALWKQESRRPWLTRKGAARPTFRSAWRALLDDRRTGRLLLAVGLGAAGFSMQDVLLEPYGAEVLGLSVSATTELTALLAGGTLVAFAVAARLLSAGGDSNRIAGGGALIGLGAFAAVILAAPLESQLLFRAGTAAIGFGGGMFAVGTLTTAMALGENGRGGLALGAWGAVQATAAGIAIAVGGVTRDLVTALAESGAFGTAYSGPATAYGTVYHLEMALLVATLIVIGPLAMPVGVRRRWRSSRFGLADLPG